MITTILALFTLFFQALFSPSAAPIPGRQQGRGQHYGNVRTFRPPPSCGPGA